MRRILLGMLGPALLAAAAVAAACDDEQPGAQATPPASATATETQPPGIAVTPTPNAPGTAGDAGQALAELQRTAPEAAKVIFA
ncbi:MAG: hypothetical protein ACM3S1_04275 [Hyphomicrobiales bacterium]